MKKKLGLIILLLVTSLINILGVPHGITFKDPLIFDKITVYPVSTNESNNQINYLTLDKGIESKQLKITEKGSGDVPQVEVSNFSENYIFLMAGEIISGGKQDRIIAKNIIIGPKKKKVRIPVFCVEAGRWNTKTKNFYSEKNLGTSNLRSIAQEGPNSQSKIWNEVEKTSKKNKIQSDTSAYQDIYRDKEIENKTKNIINSITKYMDINTDISGFLITYNDYLISFDLFTNKSIAKALLPKIIKASCIMVPSEEEEKTITKNEVEALLKNGEKIGYEKIITSGEGTLYKSNTKKVHLYLSNHVNNTLHISILPVIEDNTNNQELSLILRNNTSNIEQIQSWNRR